MAFFKGQSLLYMTVIVAGAILMLKMHDDALPSDPPPPTPISTILRDYDCHEVPVKRPTTRIIVCELK